MELRQSAVIVRTAAFTPLTGQNFPTKPAFSNHAAPVLPYPMVFEYEAA